MRENHSVGLSFSFVSPVNLEGFPASGSVLLSAFLVLESFFVPCGAFFIFGCLIVLPVSGPGFRGRFGVVFGRKPRVNGPTSRPQLPPDFGPFALG